MIFSGPKSYYDEHVRKSGSQRILSDPSSLLTDRGAYVNFLEVQLERVSAACLGIQSYDSRFDDMQNLIVSLETRCGNTTKLLSLVQKCVEEVSADNSERNEKLISDLKSSEKSTMSLVQTMSTRISAIEQSLALLSGRSLSDLYIYIYIYTYIYNYP